MNDAKSRATVVCLCGLDRFVEKYKSAYHDEKLSGRIPITVPCFMDDAWYETKTPEDVDRWDQRNFEIVDIADEVLVAVPSDEAGGSARLGELIAHATAMGKRVRYLEPTG